MKCSLKDSQNSLLRGLQNTGLSKGTPEFERGVDHLFRLRGNFSGRSKVAQVMARAHSQISYQFSRVSSSGNSPHLDIGNASGAEGARTFAGGAGGRDDIIHQGDPRSGELRPYRERTDQVGSALMGWQVGLRRGVAGALQLIDHQWNSVLASDGARQFNSLVETPLAQASRMQRNRDDAIRGR